MRRRKAEDECSGITKTKDYVKCRAEKLEKEQGVDVGEAFATAWSIACKYKKLPDSKDHCKKSPGEYFPGKKASIKSLEHALETVSTTELILLWEGISKVQKVDNKVFTAFAKEFEKRRLGELKKKAAVRGVVSRFLSEIGM